MIPSVNDTELDGQLGILPSSSGQLQAIIGDSQSGPFDTPGAFGSATAVKSTYTSGSLVEAACYALEHYGKPVLLTRSKRTTVGTTSNLVITGVLGTCTPAVDGSVAPTDDGEIVITITVGGTVGTGPISYTWSRDGGRTVSVATALGIAEFITVPVAGVKFLLDHGSTLLAGDTWSCVAHAPRGSTNDWADSIDALGASKQNWEYCTILGDALGADLDMVEGKRTGMAAKGKHRWFQLAFRVPNVGESDATYQAAFSTAFNTHRSTGIEVFAGGAKIQSSVSFFQYRRSPIYAVAPIYASVSHEVDIAKILLAHNPLPGVQIRDANGNLDEHDELEQPGLDDMMATVLRTWDGRDGVFVNNPRIHSAVGSDFVLVQYRRVMNVARTALRSYLETRLSNEVVVDAKTGFLIKSEADDIDSGANAALSAVLDGAPKASPSSPSKPRFAVSRTDNVLATQLVHYQCRIIPLGYIKELTGETGFDNPANRVVVG